MSKYYNEVVQRQRVLTIDFNRNQSWNFTISEGGASCVQQMNGMITAIIEQDQGWQVAAKSGLNHWFLPVKTGWQKRWVAKSGKK